MAVARRGKLAFAAAAFLLGWTTMSGAQILEEQSAERRHNSAEQSDAQTFADYWAETATSAEGTLNPEMIESLSPILQAGLSAVKNSDMEAAVEPVRLLSQALCSAQPSGPVCGFVRLAYGAALELSGRYAEAEHVLRGTFDFFDEANPGQHAVLVIAWSKLGATLDALGRYDEAVSWHSKALSVVPANPTRDTPPEVKSIMHSAALNLNYQGKYKEAEEQLRRVVDLCRLAMPEDAENLATVLSTLASNLSRQARHEETRRLHEEAYELRRATLPAGHPDIAGSLIDAASFMYSEGQFESAENHVRRAIGILNKSVYHDHPDLGTARSLLAHLLDLQGGFEEAEQMHQSIFVMHFRVNIPIWPMPPYCLPGTILHNVTWI